APARTEGRTLRCLLARAEQTRRQTIARLRAARSNLAPLALPQIEWQPGPALLADASLTQEFYAGRFPLGGIAVDTAGLSPFELSSAPRHWQRRLHSFAWLRHLEAANNGLAKQLAQSLVDEWLQLQTSRRGSVYHSDAAWELDVAADRLVSWITHAGLLTAGRDEAFVQKFLDGLARSHRFLKNRYDYQGLTSENLMAGLALTYAAHTLRTSHRAKTATRRQLHHTLAQQCPNILAKPQEPDDADTAKEVDVVHISRRPSVAMELIPLLVSAGAAIAGQPDPQNWDAKGKDDDAKHLVNVLDEVTDALARWTLVAQHSGGGLAVFNGAKEESLERVTNVLALGTGDTSLFRPIETCGGYTRLSVSGTTIICDVGPTPPVGASSHAQAGTLGFEMSSGGERVIVNCGSPEESHLRDRQEWKLAARQTAAHSALTLGSQSSSSPAQRPLMRILTGHEITHAVGRPKHQTGEHGDGQIWLNAQHLGYEHLLGSLHRRAISVSANGRTVEGEDTINRIGELARSIRPTLPADGSLPVELRFHLAHGCRAHIQSKTELGLKTAGGRNWTFTVEMPTGFSLSIAPSLQINNPGGPASIQQIVVAGSMAHDQETLALQWKLAL
ncbi:MAG: heparinase II/III family protein, partial [Pseudomonadota bacterium]